jgi:hypothetical protein
MPLIRCPDCGTEVSDQAAACIKCGRPIGAAKQPDPTARNPAGSLPRWLLVVAIAAAAYLLFVGRNPVDFIKSVSPGVEAYVECEGTLGGVACRVTRRSGSATAKACWDVEFACANGTTTSAHACHDVPAGIGSMSSRSISWDEFVGSSRCDQVLTSRVSNLVLQ